VRVFIMETQASGKMGGLPHCPHQKGGTRGGWLGGRRLGFSLSHLFLLCNLFFLLTFLNMTVVIYDFLAGLSFGRTRSCCLGQCSDLWRSSTGGHIVSGFLATEALLLLSHASFSSGVSFGRFCVWTVVDFYDQCPLERRGEGLARHKSLVGVPADCQLRS